MIRHVTEQDNFHALAKLLNDSFATVAADFGLTRENAPTNNAFLSGEELKSQLTTNRSFYYFDMNGTAAGFIAIEQSARNPDTFYIEKVAVHPDFRHQGIGRQLMEFATDQIRETGGKKISIGLINANSVLKAWYTGLQFTVYEVKLYAHLPFEVCMMEKTL